MKRTPISDTTYTRINIRTLVIDENTRPPGRVSCVGSLMPAAIVINDETAEKTFQVTADKSGIFSRPGIYTNARDCKRASSFKSLEQII
jgi:hypothetical protein